MVDISNDSQVSGTGIGGGGDVILCSEESLMSSLWDMVSLSCAHRISRLKYGSGARGDGLEMQRKMGRAPQGALGKADLGPWLGLI